MRRFNSPELDSRTLPRHQVATARKMEDGGWWIGNFNHPSSLLHPQPSSRPPRSGAVLIEAIVAGVVLATVMTAAASTMLWIRQQRQSAAQQQAAIAEIANLMERLTLNSYAELTDELAASQAVTLETEKILRDPRLTVTIEEATGPPPSKRIALKLTWLGPSGQPAAPCRLTAWVTNMEAQP